MSMADKMMEFMMGEMSKEDKEKMIDKFFADMTPDDKRRMMEQMAPKMMEAMSVMMGMMSRMKESVEGMEMPKMDQMMTEMMPKCLAMVLPDLSKEERTDFVTKLVGALVEQASSGMSGEEKNGFRAKLAERIGIGP